MARFAGQNVHKRLINEEAYHAKRYDEALKRAFLGTDEDLLAGQSDAHINSFSSSHYRHIQILRILVIHQDALLLQH